MTDTPFRGILYGVTEVPGYERPVVDGELCDGEVSVPADMPVYMYGYDGRPQLVAHSAKEMVSGLRAISAIYSDWEDEP